MRALLFVLGAALLIGRPGLAAPPAAGEGEGRTNLELKDVPLRQAVAALFRGTGIQYTVDPNVPDPRITLNVREVSPAAGLRLILRLAAAAAPGLTSSRDEEIYLIKLRSSGVPPPAPSLPSEARERKVTLNLQGAPLRSALDVLFGGSGIRARLDANVPNVPISLSLTQISLQQALRLILRQAAITAPGIVATARDTLVSVHFLGGSRPQFSDQPEPEAADPVATPGPEAADPPVGLEWTRIALRYTEVGVIIAAVGGTLLPEGETPAPPAPRRAAPPLVLPEIPAAPPPAVKPPKSAALRPKTDYPPSHLRLDGLAGGSGAFPGVPSGFGAAPVPMPVPAGVEAIVGVRSQNALLVRGTKAGTEALEKLVRLIDVRPRQYRLRISAGALAAEGHVLNNATLSLTDARGAERLITSLTPRANEDGTIEVRIEGVLRLASGEHPLQSRVRLRPEEAAPCLNLGSGARARRIWLRISEIPAK